MPDDWLIAASKDESPLIRQAANMQLFNYARYLWNRSRPILNDEADAANEAHRTIKKQERDDG